MTVVGVVGAAGYVGQAVVSGLIKRSMQPIGFSRQDRPADQFEWQRLSDETRQQIPFWIDVGPIWTFEDRRDDVLRRGARKIVATSSTSRFTKSALGNAKEAETARQLEKGETDFARWCEAHAIDWVILRPTLIYGMGQDKNIREIAAMIRRFGMFPIFGDGTGWRQPIHAEDLGAACVLALLSPASGKCYNVSGAEVLTYREMVERIFAAMGRRPMMPTVPLPVFKAALSMLNRVPRFAHWTPQMAERMNINMAFDHSDAARDFGFAPRGFSVDILDL